MGKACKWFAKMTTCIFGFKKAKKNVQTSSPCNETKQSPGDQIPASNHHHLAREVAAAIVAADSAAASISEAAAAVGRARDSFSKGGGGEASTANAAAVKIQKTLRGADDIPAAGNRTALLLRERLLNKYAQSAAVTKGGDCICTTSHDGGEASPAVTKIQKIYRGHLARRGLRALKALVKVQALFRGRRVRKGIEAVWIQALIRARENMSVPPADNVCRRSPNFMSPTMSWKAKLKKEAEAGTGEKKQQYLLFVEKTGCRWQRTFARRNSFEA